MYDRIKNHIGGVESASYEVFGAHMRDGGVSFTVLAPNAKNVLLRVRDHDPQDIQMNRDDLGAWNVFVPNLGEGARYRYIIHTQDERVLEKTDPFAFYYEVRPNHDSIVYDINNYFWKDDDWMRRRSKSYSNPLNIYEVHLGTWKVKQANGDDKLYRYEELIGELIPYVKEMGYTHIEFMPLCEHPYDGSWGYHVSGYYAPTSRYGEPRYLMYLIDVCHQNGVGAILDFVPAHFARDEFALPAFDGTCMYESDVPELQNSAWGSLRFDYSKGHVQSFVRSAVNFWISCYHFDGIRFDAVGYLIYPDGNPNSPVNDCGLWFIRSATFTMRAYHPDVMLIAEDSAGYAKETAPTVYGGLGFDYTWNFGWSAQTLRYITLPYELRAQNHDMLTYPMYYFNRELYMLALSHDEVANGSSTIMARTYGKSQQEKFANLRTYYMYHMTHPGKKMSFMGNELAEYMAWNDTQPIGWNLLTYPAHDGFHEYMKELNRIYLSEPPLSREDYNMMSFAWIDLQNAANNIYAYRRDDMAGQALYVALNFSPYQKEYWLAVGYDGCFRELLTTDMEMYGGSGTRNYELRSKDGYLRLVLAPLSGVIIKPCGEDDLEYPPAPPAPESEPELQEEPQAEQEELTQEQEEHPQENLTEEAQEQQG